MAHQIGMNEPSVTKEAGMAIHKETLSGPIESDSKTPAVTTSSASGPSPTSAPEPAPEISAPDPSQKRFAYLRTRSFYLVLALGQILALCLTGTNTLTTLLFQAGTSIPAFQNLLLYTLLTLIYTPITIYQLRPSGYGQMLRTRSWKYLILAFCDVQANYFIVLAYRYTTILSAQLINFWAIVVVVLISRVALHVRYHWSQIVGIVVCIGGMGVLLASDYIQSAGAPDEGGPSRADQVKGDLFALLAASFYGLSNVAEEYLVSRQPLPEVVGQLGLWGMIIVGVQGAIFDRAAFRAAVWTGPVGGYLAGYALILAFFYSLAPILYRLASAAFLNISLLTANFWGVVIGVRVFGYSVHWMYPIAFVCIVLGQCVYYLGQGVWGEATKAWLGAEQERGVDGVGTARRAIVRGRARGNGEREGEVVGV